MAPRGEVGRYTVIDEWIKDVAPSTALRKWFGHDPARWQEFRSRYAVEVHKHPEQPNRLQLSQGKTRSGLLGQTKRKPTMATAAA